MELIIIVALLLIGLVLLVVEVVFIPGTTVVGILGIVISVVGILFCYNHYGNEVGFYVLMGTLISTAIALYLSFKKSAWDSFALKSSINSKVNEGLTSLLKVGDEGVTISTLRPTGKAEFAGQVVEVTTGGVYLGEKQKIKIVLIDANKITVESIT
jgi:membrane-bound ClpP family serine protease